MTSEKGFRSQYPADMVKLPPPLDDRQDRHVWYARFLGRIEVNGERGVIPRVPGYRGRLIPEAQRSAHWVWTGARQSDGRAAVRIHGKVKSVPRVLWTMMRGGSPDTRRVIHRTCDERLCVNPWHAELVPRGSWQGQGPDH